MVVLMKPPIFVRSLSEEEREALTAGLRSKDAFVLRRSQILLASSRAGTPRPRSPRVWEADPRRCETPSTTSTREGPPGCSGEPGSSRPKRTRAAFDEESAEAVREMLHRSPREFGRDSSLWTLEMAAQVSFEEGLAERLVSGETIRATLARLLGVRWQRAKRWITSPDPLYERKKGGAMG
jgi:hypothetical protein